VADPLEVAAERRGTSMSLTAAERSLRAKIGAHALHAHYDGVALTERARAKFLATFEHQVDPNGVLPPEVRQRRALHARRAHMARLSLAASKARARRRSGSPP
jgi:hypothetical protein